MTQLIDISFAESALYYSILTQAHLQEKHYAPDHLKPVYQTLSPLYSHYRSNQGHYFTLNASHDSGIRSLSKRLGMTSSELLGLPLSAQRQLISEYLGSKSTEELTRIVFLCKDSH